MLPSPHQRTRIGEHIWSSMRTAVVAIVDADTTATVTEEIIFTIDRLTPLNDEVYDSFGEEFLYDPH
jgi:hypothetical protein